MAHRPAPQKISSATRPSKCGNYTLRPLKRRSRIYGHIWQPLKPTGRLVYWAVRRDDQRFFKDNSWAIDKETIDLLRTELVTHVGILLADGTSYLTEMKTFGSWGRANGVVDRDYSTHVGKAEGAKGQLGANQWYVPMELWEKSEPPEEERVKAIAKKMRIGRPKATRTLEEVVAGP